MEDNELLADFVVEANEHLADIENQFLAIEEAAPSIDVNLVNEVFRAIHSIKGAAGFLGLRTVNDLAHNLENVLNMMRNEELTPTSAIVDDMLKGADALKGLIEDVENSNSADVGTHIAALEKVAAAAMEIGNEPVAGSRGGRAREGRRTDARTGSTSRLWCPHRRRTRGRNQRQACRDQGRKSCQGCCRREA